MSPLNYQRPPAVMDRPSRYPMGTDEIDSRAITSERGTLSVAAVLEYPYEELLVGWRLGRFRPAMDADDLYHAPVSGFRMTFAHFVKTKFIPEHVQLKTRAGRIHYQAALKHLITPEAVNDMFKPGGIAQARLRSVPQWPYLDEVSLGDIDSNHVRDLIAAANAADYSAQTVRHIKNVLFAVISHAQKEGCFNGLNPASEVKLPKIVRRKQRHLTFEQTKAVLRALSSPLHEIAIFAISTDMTLGEICELQWKHVNLNDTERIVDGELIPARSVAVRSAWGRSPLGIHTPACKSRNIEIHEPLFSTLLHLRRQNQSPQSNDRVIVSVTGAPISANLKSTLSGQLAKASGLPWLTWQVLRRTRSSFFADFLSQLTASRPTDEKFNAASQLNASDIHATPRAVENANPYDPGRHRAFCFGRRRQGLTEYIPRD